MHLLGQEKLDERQIKQLHRLRLELAKDEKSDNLNQQIKQIAYLVAKDGNIRSKI